VVRRAGVVIGALAALVAVAAGCSSSATGSAPGTISVVASTNVWGNIVGQLSSGLTSKKIAITSIISDPNADPHSYEASTRNELAISKADLVIENGGGYDDFMATLRKAGNARGTLINAVAVSGKPVGADFNEHVWYDFPTVEKVAARVTQFLIANDKADTAKLQADASAFNAALHAMERTEAHIKAAHGGAGVAITEPVPLYMLQACGLVNRTPTAFSHAVEAGNDVAPRVMQSMLSLISGHAIKLFAYNEQTSDAQTQQLLTAAHTDHLPVVPVTETLPAGKSYLGWMSGNLAAVESALTAS
jgi:zinc/manganese transport system substrate-binding protein